VLSIVYPARNVDRLVNVPSKKNQVPLAYGTHSPIYPNHQIRNRMFFPALEARFPLSATSTCAHTESTPWLLQLAPPPPPPRARGCS
jgi:hypothetical protein